MARIRIVLACWSMKWIDLWKAMLTQEPDMQIVAEASDPIDVLLKVGATQPAVVAIDLPPSGEDPGICSHLLAEYPRVKVVAVSQEGNSAIVYELGMPRKQLQDTSPQSLTQLIRWLTINANPGP